MSLHDHSRFKVVSETQHLYEHSLDEFSYTHPALPSNGSVQDAIDYIFNVLYPKVKAEYATSALLPTGLDTPTIGDVTPDIGDQRLVADDGDGNYAMYMFAKWDGDAVAIWHKVADFDFGENNIVQGLLDQTQYLFFRKYGATDYDQVTELALTGDSAGQHIYGGDLANQNLILHANNGDTGAAHTGAVLVDDVLAPFTDLEHDLGATGKRFLTGYVGTMVIGTASMTITSNGATGLITDTNGVISFDDENLVTTGDIDGSIITASTNLAVDDTTDQLIIGIGSITDTTGAISFGDENLSTSGTLASGVATIDTTLVLSTGSITDSSGEISFGDEDLVTTGDINAAIATFDSLDVDDLNLDGNTLSISTLNASLNLVANGTGVIDLQSAVTAITTDITGVLTVTGSAVVDSITLDGTAVSVVGNILTTPQLVPDVATRDIGITGNRYRSIYLSGSILDDTGDMAMSDLMTLSRAPYRDVAKTQPAQAGDVLEFDTVSGKFLASAAGGKNNYNAVHTDVQLGSPINISATITDARQAIWQLHEITSGDIMAVPINTTATLVTIGNTVPLPVGSYRLIGIQV